MKIWKMTDIIFFYRLSKIKSLCGDTQTLKFQEVMDVSLCHGVGHLTAIFFIQQV